MTIELEGATVESGMIEGFGEASDGMTTGTGGSEDYRPAVLFVTSIRLTSELMLA